MTQVFTDHGMGEIVETVTSRGRTQHKVAGKGFSVWLDDTKVRRVASDNFSDEPVSHVNEDNSTDLPYDFTPQFPVDFFDDEQTISPDHEIDADERTSPTDSVSGESGEEREYPGPNPDLFAKSGGKFEDTYLRDEPYDDEDAYWESLHGPGTKVHEHGKQRAKEIEMSKSVLGTRSAGLSGKYVQIEAEVDHFNDPVQRFRDDPVGHIQRLGYVNISAGLDKATGEWMDLVEADKSIRTAAWRDVRAKAMRLKREGHVTVKDMTPGSIMASVVGDNGTYDVVILKGASIGGVEGHSISNWHCGCEWGNWAFKRKLTFVGRLCSHAYASYLTLQSASMKGKRPTRRTGPSDAVVVKRPSRDRYLPTFTYAAGRRSASIVDDFKSWVEDANNGHQDTGAADKFIAMQDERLTREEAEKVYEYVNENPAQRWERNYDIDGGYTFDMDKVYKQSELLRRHPLSLTPDVYHVPEGEEEHFTSVEEDERETTGPGQIQARRLARLVVAELQKRWHDEKDDREPIVKFSQRRQALVYTADEDLLNKLRDLSAEAPGENNGSMREHVEEVADVVGELRDRGYDASPLVASIVRFADSTGFDDYLNKITDGAISAPSGKLTENPSAGGDYDPRKAPGVTGGPNTSAPKDPTGGLPSGPLGELGKVPGAPSAAPASQAAGPAATQAAPATGPSGNNSAAPAAGDGGGDWSPNGNKDKIGEGDYKIQKGDTLTSISDRSGVGVDDLMKGNSQIKNKDLIFADDTLKVPGAPKPPSGGEAAPAAPPGGGSPGLAPTSGAPDVTQIQNPGNSMTNPGLTTGSRLSWYVTADQNDMEGGVDPSQLNPGSPVGRGSDYKPVTVTPSTGPAAGPSLQNDNAGTGGPSQSGKDAPASATTTSKSPGSNDNEGTGGPAQSGQPGGSGGLGDFTRLMSELSPMIGQIGSGIGTAIGQVPNMISGIGQGISGLTHLLHGSQQLSWYKDAAYGIGDQAQGLGSADWADFHGSGAAPKLWSQTSQNYVDEYERPDFTELTDLDGDITSYTRTQPKQSSRRQAGDLVQGPLPSYPPGKMFNRPGEEEMYRLKYMNDPRQHGGPDGAEWSQDYSNAEQKWLDAYRAEHATPDDDADGYDDEDGYRNARRIHADDPHNQMGYFNPKLNLGQSDSGEAAPPPRSPGEKPNNPGKSRANEAAGGEAAEDAEAAAKLAAAGYDDGSDVVRQFQASGGGALNAPASGGGSYSDDAIAKQAQRLLRTAGRVYSPAEQRELEEEFHPKGARNLNGLDLEGTHYL